MRRILVLAFLGAIGLALWGCATVLPNVDLDPPAGAPPPSALGAFGDDAPVATAEEWRERRSPLLLAALEEAVYGPMPADAAARVVERADIAYAPLEGLGRVEQWTIAVAEGEEAPRFNLMLITPEREDAAPAPLIVMQNFCGNRAAFKGRPDAIAAPLTPVFPACEKAWADPLITAAFGRHINAPPYKKVLARGYALALFYAGDVVGDEPASAREGLARLYGEDAERAGAIAAWAWLYSRAIDALSADARIDAARIAVWGHSRNGKAALLAAAHDPRIAAVIAHQSGRGGASLTHGGAGESLAEIMETYPYWFTPAFAHADATAPEIDQHQLLALIAPRPVLLGNARRDAWADPVGAFRAAEAADSVYEFFGVAGLDQARMSEANLNADIAYYIRSGTHGVTSKDWRVFLDFLDAHLGEVTPASASRAR